MKTSVRNLEAELEALTRLPESGIDTSEIPEVSDWSEAVAGKFYRPIKEPVTIRLDADILAWLKAQGPGYQTRINALLRRTMPDLKTLRKRSRHGNGTRRQKACGATRSTKRKQTSD
jgi:uncharacterized protein (DUF4415 family)